MKDLQMPGAEKRGLVMPPGSLTRLEVIGGDTLAGEPGQSGGLPAISSHIPMVEPDQTGPIHVSHAGVTRESTKRVGGRLVVIEPRHTFMGHHHMNVMTPVHIVDEAGS